MSLATDPARAFGTPLTWEGVEKRLGEIWPTFQPRLPQRKLATYMAERITATSSLGGAFCQAPTGTGKSFPLLVTLIDDALERGTVNLAATATKALQDQYIRDLEFLKTEVYDGAFQYALLKGRGNYVCRAKLAKFDEALNGISVDEIVAQSSDPEVNGDVDRLQLDITPRVRSELTMSSTECPGKNDCKFGSTCFAEAAKTRAAEAHVVVVNHAMVATDAVLVQRIGQGMLPNYDKIGVDEAHELAEYVANALSVEVTERGISNLVTEVCGFIDRNDLIGTGGAAAATLFSKLRTVLSNAGRNERQVVFTPALLLEIEEELVAVIDFLNQLAAKATLVEAHGDEEVMRKKRLRRRLANSIDNVSSIILTDFADMVRWVELDEYTEGGRTKGRGVLLAHAPLKVAEFMNEFIWNRAYPLLVSATLATEKPPQDMDDEDAQRKRMRYMANVVGLDLTGKPFGAFDCESPFDYAEQAAVYIAGDIPNPRSSRDGHRSGVNVGITRLVEASKGRALVLFTSRDGLNSSYQACKPAIEAMGYRVLRQGDLPTRVLAEEFKNDRHSVLFATKSFFTGVDVQGESLSLLILDKAPFHVPTVVWRAQCDIVDNEAQGQFMRSSFMKKMLPDMRITLDQAIGRLIRSVTDRGLIAIMDPALAPGGPKYGKTVREGLPPAPQFYRLEQAEEFARSIPVAPDLDNLPDLAESEDDLEATEA